MSRFIRASSQTTRLAVPLLVGAVVLLLLLYRHQSSEFRLNYADDGSSHRNSKELVVASLKDDDVSWIHEHFPDWSKAIYVADDPQASLTVPKNKGRESMVYLTYIIDNYDHLPDIVVFMHGLRYQWHNDDPIHDGIPMLQKLQLPYIASQGYVNIRCVWVLGCPEEIHPLKADSAISEDADTERAFQHAFLELFPGKPVPDAVGVSCCAQFAVSRDKLLERPKEDYEFWRRWLLETPIEDSVSGRIMEYSWHMFMGRPPIHCPDAAACYCNVFGLCDLNCTESACDGRYQLPRFSTMPEGWPENAENATAQ
ncbi:MAG: hypothetical protein M1817_001522 [Caeruleum heppii]|nr:MAG: hypothetical protein M1817_001522 [Caeruleum heppii]